VSTDRDPSVQEAAAHAAPYAARPATVRLEDCFFYHTMDLPRHGRVDGLWDLRGRESAYLGRIDLRGRRVLEIGTASGHLCFHMERQGAEVVAFDLSPDTDWDIVPFDRADNRQVLSERREHIRRINNSFWLAHEALGSRARVVHGSVYAIPEAIGPVDTSVFCSVLLHVRDPFLALQNTLRLTTRNVVITERVMAAQFPGYLLGQAGLRAMTFLPRFRKLEPLETWWALSPRVLKALIGVLGFERARTSYHFQRCRGRRRLMFTIVGERATAG
jgi:SAM-dependent methyltransferase